MRVIIRIFSKCKKQLFTEEYTSSIRAGQEKAALSLQRDEERVLIKFGARACFYVNSCNPETPPFPRSRGKNGSWRRGDPSLTSSLANLSPLRDLYSSIYFPLAFSYLTVSLLLYFIFKGDYSKIGLISPIQLVFKVF